jgi:uncharacterized repeat protein (TIGR01451 family)/MYXO-CTERM domain-containing protein
LRRYSMRLENQVGVIVAIALTTVTAAHGQSPTADLNAIQSAPVQSDADTDVAFDVTVVNNGPDPADNVVLADSVPAGTSFVSAVQNSGPAFSCSTPAPGATAGGVSCAGLILASGASANFTLVFHIDSGTAPGAFITSVATVTTDTLDPNEENNSGPAVTQTPPPPGADLRVTLDGPAGSIPGADVIYTLDLINGGPGDATSVILEVTIPVGMTVGPITQTAGPALCCNSDPAGFTCTAVSFAAGVTASLTIEGNIPLATGSGMTFQTLANVSSSFDPTTENDAATTLLCVQTNSCEAGPCNGQTAVVCAPTDQCHDPGTCNTTTGLCSASPPRSNGAPCNDSNGCTPSDTCQSGVCIGVGSIICPAADQCHDQGACVGSTGLCAPNLSKIDGTACNDGNACTQGDTCQTGACQGGTALDCDDGNRCTMDICDAVVGCLHIGECDAATGDALASDSSGNAQPDGRPAGTADGPRVADGPPAGSADGAPANVADAARIVDAARLADAAAGADVARGDGPGGTAPADAAGPVLVDAGPGAGMDAGVDGRTPDARVAVADADLATATSAGCNCRAAGRNGSRPPLLWLVVLGLFVIRRGRFRNRR